MLTELQIRIDWSELDIFNHVNNVAYAKYFQACRVKMMEEIGIIESYHKKKIDFMVAASGIQYKEALNYPGNILIKTGVKEIKNSSFIIQHNLYNDSQKLCATGEDVLVYYDFNKLSKCLLTDELVAELQLRILK